MDKSTLNKILDYNRLKSEAVDINRKLYESRKELLEDIAEIANKAKLSSKDLEEALTPF